jgi:hypothetical protein
VIGFRLCIAGLSLLLSTAVVLLTLALFLVLDVYVAEKTLTHGVHGPAFLIPLSALLSKLLQPLIPRWTYYLGWYVTLLGVFSSIAEMASMAKGTDYVRSISHGFRVSIGRSAKVLGGGVVLAILLSILSMCGRHRGSAMVYARHHEELFRQGRFWSFFKDAVSYDFDFRVSLSIYVFLLVSSASLTIATVFFMWSIGSWGILRLLMSISMFLARQLRIQKAFVPISSILLALIGIALMII